MSDEEIPKRIEWTRYQGGALVPEEARSVGATWAPGLVNDALHRHLQAELNKQVRAGAVFSKLMGPRKTLTRWQRLERRFEDYRDRVALAWRALKGENIRDD